MPGAPSLAEPNRGGVSRGGAAPSTAGSYPGDMASHMEYKSAGYEIPPPRKKVASGGPERPDDMSAYSVSASSRAPSSGYADRPTFPTMMPGDPGRGMFMSQYAPPPQHIVYSTSQGQGSPYTYPTYQGYPPAGGGMMRYAPPVGGASGMGSYASGAAPQMIPVTTSSYSASGSVAQGGPPGGGGMAASESVLEMGGQSPSDDMSWGAAGSASPNPAPGTPAGTSSKAASGEELKPVVQTATTNATASTTTTVMTTGDTSTPRKQKVRFPGDIYTPAWVRFIGHQKEGFCDQCPKPGRWLQLKNSAYW
ncbi:hypothetical protein HK104_005061 [Borealophlyctis nickersoniae]|nr:hypothetical protein HK104_005061 [Borealophlyctis nickersoniae]